MGLLLILVVMLLGGDPAALLTLLTGETGAATTPASPPTGGDDEVGDFVAHVRGDTEVAWGVCSPAPESATRRRPWCSTTIQCSRPAASAAPLRVPSTCPGDQKVYLDLSFLRELQRLGAPGDFAFAYVIAHEVC